MFETLKAIYDLAVKVGTVLAANLTTAQATLAAMTELASKAANSTIQLDSMRQEVSDISAAYDNILDQLSAGDLSASAERAIYDQFAAGNKKLKKLANPQNS